MWLALGNGGYIRKEMDQRDREVVGTMTEVTTMRRTQSHCLTLHCRGRWLGDFLGTAASWHILGNTYHYQYRRMNYTNRLICPHQTIFWWNEANTTKSIYWRCEDVKRYRGGRPVREVQAVQNPAAADRDR